MLLNKMAAAAFRALSTLTTCGRRSLTTTSSPMLFPLTLPLPPFNPSGNGPYDATELSSIYRSNYAWLKGKKLPRDVDPKSIFANDEVNLGKIWVYGFDYDYTLATYKPSVESLIHEVAKNILVDKYKYPEAVKEFEYRPNSVIRGLHYDISMGLLMKLDSFGRIEVGTVYRGHRTQLTDEEILRLYRNRHLPATFIEPSMNNKRMVQLADSFSKPEMCLLADVIQWFMDNQIDYQPESIYHDVRDALRGAHPVFHDVAAKNPEKVLDNKDGEGLRKMLEHLRQNGKQTFVVTNSPFKIVDGGMKFMLGSAWQDLFDVVIVQAKKPSFFNDQKGFFREFSVPRDRLKWRPVTELLPSKVYAGGTIYDLQKLTGWHGDRVLYFGDHVYADLADLSLTHGWRTGAVILDLEEEIINSNASEFKWMVNWSTLLSMMIEHCQDSAHSGNPESVQILNDWALELSETKHKMKTHFNPKFGSVFRTRRNPTFFSKRLFAYSDIYTSKVTNLTEYSINHTFYPRRGALPHEFRSWYN